MNTMADHLIPPQSIWTNAEWVEQRNLYAEYKALYDGEEAKTKKTDDGELMYPLMLNPSAKVCRIHRAVLFGMRDEELTLPVRPLIQDADVSLDDRRMTQDMIEDVWTDSDGIATLEEAGLLLQIYGGQFFKVRWDPFNLNLQHGISVQSFKSPAWCLPVYDLSDPFNLHKAYIGYYISAELAKSKYHVDVAPDKDKVFYLETWDKATWSVKIDGKVATEYYPDGRVDVNGQNQAKLEGANLWGAVPIVYIPHERDGKFYGQSLIRDMAGLTRELNSREADIGDAVSVQTHRTLAVKNAQGRTNLKMRPILGLDGKKVNEALDLGNKPAMQHSGDPHMWAIENPDVPSAVQDFPSELWGEIRTATDIASVAMGEDDVSGGRITGPVTAYRMWPTMSHCMTERSNFATGMNHIAKLILRIARVQTEGNQYKAFGRISPTLPKMAEDFRITQSWYPMIPIEALQKNTMLNARLAVGGISVHQYLIEMREQNVKEEEERIWADRERLAEIERGPENEAGPDIQ